MKKVCKILTIVSLACVLTFYLFDLPRHAYNLKEYVQTQMGIDSLQNERIYNLELNRTTP